MANWAKWAHDRLTRSLNFITSSTVSVKETSRGVSFHAAPQQGGGPSANPIQYTAFKFIRSFDDYILVKELDSLNQHRVAKPFKLRNSITGAVIYQSVWAYTYPHNGAISDSLYGIYRVGTNSTVNPAIVERMGIVPQYLADDIILAIDASSVVAPVAVDPLDTTAAPGEQITLLDTNEDGRAWTAFANQKFGK